MKDTKKQAVAHWELIDRLARKRFGATSLAEEAALFVMNGLVGDNGRRLLAYSGKAPFTTFLSAVAWSLFEDFSRKRYGRRRPPKWIRNLGGIWMRLYMLLCFERMNIDDAVQIVEQERKGSHFDNPEDAAWQIKGQIVDCGSHQGLEVGIEGQGGEEQSFQEVLASTSRHTEENEKDELFRMLFAVLTEADETVVERNLVNLSSLRIVLQPEEKLLLKLCYQDGLNVTRAGKILGLNRHQVHGRMRRLLARIRREFEQSGLAREILEMLHETE